MSKVFWPHWPGFLWDTDYRPVFLVICDLAVNKHLVYHFEELTFDCASHSLEVLTDTISTQSFVRLPFVHGPLQFFHCER